MGGTSTSESAVASSKMDDLDSTRASTASTTSDEELDEELARGGWIDTRGVKRPMTRLVRYAATYRVLFATACAGAVLNKIFDLAPPLLTAWVVDSIAGSPPRWLVVLSADKGNADGSHPRVGAWNIPIAIFVLTLGIFLFESFFQWVYQLSFKILAQRAQHRLRLDAYVKMQARELAFFESRRSGDLTAALTSDVNSMERFLNEGIAEIIHYVITVSFACGVSFAVSWPLTLIGLLPTPLIVWASFVFQRTVQPRYARVQGSTGQLAARLENNIAGIGVIKAFTSEAFEESRVAVLSDEYKQAAISAARATSLYTPVIRMAIAAGYAGVLMVGLFWSVSKRGTRMHVSAGELAMVSMLMERTLWPMTRLGLVLDSFQKSKAAALRVFAVLDGDCLITSAAKPRHFAGKARRARGDVSFDSVTFAYSARGAPVLDRFSLDVRAGSTVGLAGATGAGKSTILKLLLRLYDPRSGVVRIDGLDVRALSLDELRRNVALVSQDVYLFHGSIFENIAYGTLPAPDLAERVEAAARMAHLHEFVDSLPDGYQTMVGERGIKLSGGQKQRLSIARAVLKDAPIMVFDEATASVDTETERIIQTNLAAFTAGRTSIVIAHRLSTIRTATQIVVLEQGRVAEIGRHDELVHAGGPYSRLWAVQIGELESRAASESGSGSGAGEPESES